MDKFLVIVAVVLTIPFIIMPLDKDKTHYETLLKESNKTNSILAGRVRDLIIENRSLKSSQPVNELGQVGPKYKVTWTSCDKYSDDCKDYVAKFDSRLDQSNLYDILYKDYSENMMTDITNVGKN